MSWDPELGNEGGCYWNQHIDTLLAGLIPRACMSEWGSSWWSSCLRAFPVVVLDTCLLRPLHSPSPSNLQASCLTSLGPWLFPAPTRSLQHDAQICSSGFLTTLDPRVWWRPLCVKAFWVSYPGLIAPWGLPPVTSLLVISRTSFFTQLGLRVTSQYLWGIGFCIYFLQMLKPREAQGSGLKWHRVIRNLHVCLCIYPAIPRELA